jgi:hypothetical protein
MTKPLKYNNVHQRSILTMFFDTETMFSGFENIFSKTETIFSRAETKVETILTMICGGGKMFSSLYTIFSKGETVVEVPETMFSALVTLVSTIKAIVFLAETTVCGTETCFSQADPSAAKHQSSDPNSMDSSQNAAEMTSPQRPCSDGRRPGMPRRRGRWYPQNELKLKYGIGQVIGK